MSDDSTNPEKAINDYLTCLHRPDDLIDQEEISALQGKLETTTNFAERITLRAKLRRAQIPPVDEYEEVFVHADIPHWAERNHVAIQDLRNEGVPDEALTRAGFSLEPEARRKKRYKSPRVGRREILEHAQRMSRLTANDLVEATGCHKATAQAFIKDQETEGKLKFLSKDGRTSIWGWV